MEASFTTISETGTDSDATYRSSTSNLRTETASLKEERAQLLEKLEALKEGKSRLQVKAKDVQQNLSKAKTKVHRIEKRIESVEKSKEELEEKLERDTVVRKEIEERVEKSREIHLHSKGHQQTLKPIVALIENLEKKDRLNDELRELKQIHWVVSGIRANHIRKEFVKLAEKRILLKGDIASTQLDELEKELGTLPRMALDEAREREAALTKQIEHLASRRKTLIEHLGEAKGISRDWTHAAYIASAMAKAEIRMVKRDLASLNENPEARALAVIARPNTETNAGEQNIGNEVIGLVIWRRAQRKSVAYESGPPIELSGAETVNHKETMQPPKSEKNDDTKSESTQDATKQTRVIPEYLQPFDGHVGLMVAWARWFERRGGDGADIYRNAQSKVREYTGRTVTLDANITAEDMNLLHWASKDATMEKYLPNHTLAHAFDLKHTTDESRYVAERTLMREEYIAMLASGVLNYTAPQEHFERIKAFASGKEVDLELLALDSRYLAYFIDASKLGDRSVLFTQPTYPSANPRKSKVMNAQGQYESENELLRTPGDMPETVTA
jgi:hypothetical protein